MAESSHGDEPPRFVDGFLTTEHYPGTVSVAPDQVGLRVTASNDGGGVTLPAGRQRESEPVWFSAGPKPSQELERWGDLAGRLITSISGRATSPRGAPGIPV